MLIRQLLLIVTGASYGLLSAAGVFTVLVAVGLIPRFAGKTHTARYVLLYEEMVIFGTLAGCFVTIFPEYSQWGNYLREHFPEQMRLWTAAGIGAQAVFGLFAGMFIGCLALAIAEIFLPEESLSATGWAGPFWGWQRERSAGHCFILPQNCIGPCNKQGNSSGGASTQMIWTIWENMSMQSRNGRKGQGI